MSRIGKLPIKVPSNVDITLNGPEILIKGQFGTLENRIPNGLRVEQNDGTLIVSLENQTSKGRALHGLYRTLINNMVIGTISIKTKFEWCWISGSGPRKIDYSKFRI